MQDDQIATELRAVVAQLDMVRRGLMADEPRRRTYLQAVKAQQDAQSLLEQIEEVKTYFRLAAE
ncbi:hypothetical protein IHQ71_15480 [Rhizobium sp. TH2]|uniref:hypothetical protein n=1 Tax=Rhizobium sp. TH2 TaxID=2775403 RepID=UPI00215891D9|nr:hypothetical protein [Rhizobium sp. TH2]UVC06664.1 hypothetical protein IHQ71_15480 [Rhizobium sp. TH2]